MSKRKGQKNPGGARAQPAGSRPGRTIAMALLAGAAVFALLYRPPTGTSFESTAVEPALAPPPIADAAGARSPRDLQTLTGRWRRSDGGYVLEIRGVTATGAADVSYFNPKPIHVATARAAVDDGTLTVFVELRDVNYPGSTYSLVYEPATDRLTGIYYQAVERQRFDVVFTRSQ